MASVMAMLKIPFDFDEAIAGLLKVKPPEKPEKPAPEKPAAKKRAKPAEKRRVRKR